MTLRNYIVKRNGVPMGHPASLRNNLERSLGAQDFATFWMYWNPIFGYYLGIKIFKPLKKIVSKPVALILTFVFCGLVHDLVTTIWRGKPSLFFAVWFLLMSFFVLFSKAIKYNFSRQSWTIRAFHNITIIGVCFTLTWRLNTFINFS